MCDCGANDLVTDTASGDVVCQQCGVVVESHIFDEHLEYYSETMGTRAGPPESWLLPCQPTVVDNMPSRSRLLSNADPHASTREMFTLLEWLGRKFSTDVVDTAKLLCRDLVAQKPVRGDSKHVSAACALYLATKMHGHGIGRSKKEIAAEFQALGVTERGLTSTAKMFKDVLHLSPYAAKLFSGLDAGDLINRCVDRLDVDDPTRKSIKRLAHQLAGQVAAEDVEGKTPCGICSGVVNCALLRLGIKLSKKHLTESCRVSGATLDKMTKVVSAVLPAPACCC